MGAKKDLFPWHLADWVEEVQDISSLLEATFHPVLREANSEVHKLAKEVVFVN